MFVVSTVCKYTESYWKTDSSSLDASKADSDFELPFEFGTKFIFMFGNGEALQG